MRKATAILNPAAASGKASRFWRHFKTELDGGIDCRECVSDSPGHATELARHALQNGDDLILAIGGDGTLNEVVNGFFDGARLINPEASLAIVARGTGMDFVRSLAIPQTSHALLEAIRENRTRTIDLGVVTCQSLDGEEILRYFINVADCGYGGALLQKLGKLKRILPGPPAYFLGLFINLLTYKNPKLRFRIDDGAEQQGRFNALIAANGQFFGGGMWIAPKAELDDGVLEMIQLGDVTKWQVVTNVRRIYSGKLCEHPKVICLRGKKLQVWSDQTVLLEVDGELPGTLPATFEIVPRALRVIV